MVKSTQVPASELRVALDSWPLWCSEPPRVQQDISGLSNHSYLVTSGAEQFVIRINNPISKPGINRRREKDILLAIKDEFFSPELMHWHKDYIVTRFVPNVSPHQIGSEQFAKLFYQIHQVQVTESDPLGALDAWSLLDDYLLRLPANAKTQANCIALMQSTKPTDLHETPPCLCHNDLLKANLLSPLKFPSKSPKKMEQITIIDWEYAQLGHPAFDLAVYAQTYQLSPVEVEVFLQHYNIHKSDGARISIDSLQRHQVLYQLIDLLWWQISYPKRDQSKKFNLIQQQLEHP